MNVVGGIPFSLHIAGPTQVCRMLNAIRCNRILLLAGVVQYVLCLHTTVALFPPSNVVPVTRVIVWSSQSFLVESDLNFHDKHSFNIYTPDGIPRPTMVSTPNFSQTILCYKCFLNLK